jgi:hypothetical protein
MNSLSLSSSELIVPPLDPVLLVLVVPVVSVPPVEIGMAVPDVSLAVFPVLSLWQANIINANAQKRTRVQSGIFIILIGLIRSFHVTVRFGSYAQSAPAQRVVIDLKRISF